MIVKEFIYGSTKQYIGSGTLKDVISELWYNRPEKGLFISVPSDDSVRQSLRKECEDKQYWAKLCFEHLDNKLSAIWIILPSISITMSFKVRPKMPFKKLAIMIIESLTGDPVFKSINQHSTILVSTCHLNSNCA